MQLCFMGVLPTNQLRHEASLNDSNHARFLIPVLSTVPLLFVACSDSDDPINTDLDAGSTDDATGADAASVEDTTELDALDDTTEPDATEPDSAEPDATEGDAVDTDGSTEGDTATDAAEDAATDTAQDASTDAAEDAATDTAEDATTDAAEDATTDTAEDATTDAAEDAATDADAVEPLSPLDLFVRGGDGFEGLASFCQAYIDCDPSYTSDVPACTANIADFLYGELAGLYGSGDPRYGCAYAYAAYRDCEFGLRYCGPEGIVIPGYDEIYSSCNAELMDYYLYCGADVYSCNDAENPDATYYAFQFCDGESDCANGFDEYCGS